MGRTAPRGDPVGDRIDQSTDGFWSEPIEVWSLCRFQLCLPADGQSTDPVYHHHHQLRFRLNCQGLKNFFWDHSFPLSFGLSILPTKVVLAFIADGNPSPPVNGGATFGK